MALMVVIQNDKTGTDESANYNVRVFVNGREIDRTRVEGHNRKDDWRTLIRKLAGPEPKVIRKEPGCTIDHPGESCNLACGDF